MQYIQGKDRTQCCLFPQSLDEIIAVDNDIRFIDLFVESIDIKAFSFTLKQSAEGRPAYHPKDLLKLFLYGYLNSIRSSRALEKQCHINLEVRWLLKELVPDHNTIANFRRHNEKAIRKVFRHTVRIAHHFELIGGKLIAGDSTKLRTQNSKKNNFNEKKIIQHIEYIDRKLADYNKSLSEADEDNKKTILAEIDKHNTRKQEYNKLSQKLMESGDNQVSTSDPDSRQIITRNNITEVAYNVQTTVDAHCAITIDYKVTNTNDSKAMSGMLRRAQTILQTKRFTALYDKGYHTGSELKYAIEGGINTLVAIPGVASLAPDAAYNFDRFLYDADRDCYRCPEGNELHTNGNWYQKSKERSLYFVKHYKTGKCLSCPALALCTKNKKGRLIERSEYQPYVDRNRENIEANTATYRLRQQIIEHTYGIIKRQWGFYYVISKRGMKRASADVGFMFTALNLRRIINLVDKEKLKEYLKSLFAGFLSYRKLLSVMASTICFTNNVLMLFSKRLNQRGFIAVEAYFYEAQRSF